MQVNHRLGETVLIPESARSGDEVEYGGESAWVEGMGD